MSVVPARVFVVSTAVMLSIVEYIGGEWLLATTPTSATVRVPPDEFVWIFAASADPDATARGMKI